VPAPSPSGPSSPSTAAGSPSASPAAEVPTSRRRALRAVGAAENELSAQQKQHAFASQSGAFARLLASMAAAAAQQAAVLGGEPTEPGAA
jgi:type IV secretory pathway TrbL component